MTKYNLPNISSGIDDTIVDVSQTVPSFIPMLLVFVFFTVFLGGITAQKKREGRSDLSLWATLASLATIMVALPLTLVSGIINVNAELDILGYLVVILIASGIWYFMSQKRNEV